MYSLLEIRSVAVSAAHDAGWNVTPFYCPGDAKIIELVYVSSGKSAKVLNTPEKRGEKEQHIRVCDSKFFFFILSQPACVVRAIYKTCLHVWSHTCRFTTSTCLHVCMCVSLHARLWVTHPSACVTWDSGGDAGGCANTWVEFVTTATGIQWVGAMEWLVQFY